MAVGGIGTAYDMGRAACFDSSDSLVATGFFRSATLSFEVGSDLTNSAVGPTETFLVKFGP